MNLHLNALLSNVNIGAFQTEIGLKIDQESQWMASQLRTWA